MTDVVIALVVLFIGPFVLIWWLPVLVHEMGHVLGAKLVGAAFDYVPLGPFVALRSSAGIRVRLAVRRFPCDSVLPSPLRARSQLVVATLAGPLMSLTAGVIFLALAVTDAVGNISFWAPLLFLLLGIFTIGNGLTFLLMRRPSGVPLDGQRLVSLWRDSDSARRWLALKQLISLSQRGTRPREWPAELLARLVQRSDGTTDDVAAALQLYWHLLDSGRLAEAGACLAQARAAASRHYMNELNSRLVLLELAYLEAWAGNDPSVAVENLRQSAFVSQTTLMRVLAAVRLAYSYFDDALEIVERGRRFSAELRPGFAEMELRLLDQIAREAHRRKEGAIATPPTVFGPSRVDVTRFPQPNVRIEAPRLPPGLRSARALSGFVGAALLGAGVYGLATALAGGYAVAAAALFAVAASAAVMRVRGSRGVHEVPLIREALATLAVVAAASPVLISDVLLDDPRGYIWIAGLQTPCVQFGPGHDVLSALSATLVIALAAFALLIGTRSRMDRLVPRRGLFLGIGAIVIWVLTVAGDHARLAELLGCTR